MDRLTERNRYGVAVLRMDRITGTLQDNPVARLADYEDTGLTPEEIVALKVERGAAVRDLENLMHDMRGISFCSYNKLCVTKNCYVHGEGVETCTPTWRGPQKGGEER